MFDDRRMAILHRGISKSKRTGRAWSACGGDWCWLRWGSLALVATPIVSGQRLYNKADHIWWLCKGKHGSKWLISDWLVLQIWFIQIPMALWPYGLWPTMASGQRLRAIGGVCGRAAVLLSIPGDQCSQQQRRLCAFHAQRGTRLYPEIFWSAQHHETCQKAGKKWRTHLGRRE